MNICIAEDEKSQAEMLCDMCRKYGNDKEINMSIKIFYSYEALLFSLEDEDNYDIYFLDIEMQNINGMEFARNLRKRGYETAIAFITGTKEYVFQGYDLDAIGYVLKPYTIEQIYKVLDKVLKRCEEEHKDILLEVECGTIRMKYKDIHYIEANVHNCTVNGNEIIKRGINDLYELLPENFIKIHRSIVVNINQVVRVEKNQCTMEDKIMLPIARGSYEKVMQAFIKCNRGE